MESEVLSGLTKEAESDAESPEQDLCVSHGWRSVGGEVLQENLTTVTGLSSQPKGGSFDSIP